jgi:exoribonuclease-2
MLAAGEGAALWAMKKRLPFPFVGQEVGEFPEKIAPAYAGEYQLRKIMRPRVLSNKPGLHGALGLDVYTQVTSPLRRYTDLLCHQQIRASLAGISPLSDDEILARLLQAERGALAATHAERASNLHFKHVYLAARPDSVWEAFLLDKKKPRSVVLIPDLAMEVQVPLPPAADKLALGDKLSLTLLKARISECETTWAASGF